MRLSNVTNLTGIFEVQVILKPIFVHFSFSWWDNGRLSISYVC